MSGGGAMDRNMGGTELVESGGYISEGNAGSSEGGGGVGGGEVRFGVGGGEGVEIGIDTG